MKNLLKLSIIPIILSSCINLDDIQALKEINTFQPQKDELIRVESNDKHTYYISQNEMSWKEAYNFCKRNGLQMADYMRTLYNDDMTAIIEEKPICGLEKIPGLENDAKQFIKNRKNCKIFNNITTNDTKVWIYPAIAGRISIIANLKNGNITTDIIAPDIFGNEEYTPYRALCEEK